MKLSTGTHKGVCHFVHYTNLTHKGTYICREFLDHTNWFNFTSRTIDVPKNHTLGHWDGKEQY